MVEPWMVELGITCLVGLIGYLLKAKDTSQEKLIDDQAKLIADLYAKHNADVQRLHDLELQIAQNHYPKNELNLLLGEIRDTFKLGFNDMATKLETLNNNFFSHIAGTNRRKSAEE